jgi:hypothetical protein
MITKGFYVSLLVFAGILLLGGLLFRDSEAGVQVAVVAAYLVGATVLCVFDIREGRRRKNHD